MAESAAPHRHRTMQRSYVAYISIVSVSGMQEGKPADLPSCMRATRRISSPKWTADSCAFPGTRRTNALAMSDFLSDLLITAGALLICRMICTPSGV